MPFTMYCVLYTIYIVQQCFQFTIYSIHSTLNSVPYTVYTVQFTLYNIQYAWYIIYGRVHKFGTYHKVKFSMKIQVLFMELFHKKFIVMELICKQFFFFLKNQNPAIFFYCEQKNYLHLKGTLFKNSPFKKSTLAIHVENCNLPGLLLSKNF